MAGPLAKFITKAVIKALTKRGAPSKGEKAALTRAANKAGMPVTEFKKEAKAEIKGAATKGSKSDQDVAERLGITVAELKKKRKASLKARKSKPKIKQTKKEKRETDRLVKQREAEERGELQKGAGVYGGKRVQTVRGAEDRKGLQRPHIIEAPRGRLKSKQEVDTTDWNKVEKMRQKLDPHADPASVIYKQMRGKDLSPDQLKELEEMLSTGTLSLKKSGGTVKRNKGGVVRGVGQATKGFGNATYSKKMY
jgi:hypothetical protein